MTLPFNKVSALSIVITLLILAMPTVAHAETHKDYPDVSETNSHHDAIASLSEQDVIHGYTNGDFGVWNPVRRMHVAVMLANVLDLEPSHDVSATLNVYSDIDEHFMYANEVAALTERGIFNGKNGEFQPNAPLTREQMASVLTLGFSLYAYNSHEDVAANLENVSPIHKDNVQVLLNLGISLQLNQFKPTHDISRGAFVTMLYRSQQLMRTSDTEGEAFITKVVDLTNQERKNHGLAPLQVDEKLSNAARAKSYDMSRNHYFDHYSPSLGGLPDLLKQEGVDDYARAAENIAMTYRTPEAVMNGWMNSPGHRENILNVNYDYIGVGFAEDGYYWTQEFIKKK